MDLGADAMDEGQRDGSCFGFHSSEHHTFPDMQQDCEDDYMRFAAMREKHKYLRSQPACQLAGLYQVALRNLQDIVASGQASMEYELQVCHSLVARVYRELKAPCT